MFEKNTQFFNGAHQPNMRFTHFPASSKNIYVHTGTIYLPPGRVDLPLGRMNLQTGRDLSFIVFIAGKCSC